MSRYRAHVAALSILGLPLVGSHLAQVAIGVTDTLMVGRYGAAELAAVTLGTTTHFTVFIFGSGFALALMPMVAAAEAQGDDAEVRRATRMGMWIACLFAALAYPVFWWARPLLLLLGQEAQVSADAGGYLRIAGLSLAPALMVMALKSHLAGLNRAQVVLWATIGGAAMNAILNWLLIFGNLGAPELGLGGAAIATVGTHLTMLAILALYAARGAGLGRYTLFSRIWRPDWVAFGQVFRLGWPIGLTQLAESGLFTATAIMMGWIGTLELAAHGVALQIASVTFMVHVGLSSAATVRTGRLHGRGDAQGVRDGAVAALGLSGLAVAVTVALFLGLPGILMQPFLDPDGAERAAVLAIGSGLLAVAALFQLADAAQVMALGLLRGLKDTRRPMVFALVGYWGIGVPGSYVLGFVLGLGARGIWLGLALGLAAAGTAMMWRFWRGLGRAPPPAPAQAG